MAHYHFEDLTRAKLTPLSQNQELHFHLTFLSSPSREDTAEFQLPADHAMALLSALMEMQRKFGWPLPGRPSGRSLRVVVDNSGE